MDKRAYFVVGPESSGTRLWTDILIRAGCYGQSGHSQKMDGLMFADQPARIAFRRSLPHTGSWPPLTHIIERMEAADYEVTVVKTDRDPYYTVRSQLRIGHVSNAEQARSNIARAHQEIHKAVKATGCRFTLVSYELLVEMPDWYISHRLELLGLPRVEGYEIRDGNAKYA